MVGEDIRNLCNYDENNSNSIAYSIQSHHYKDSRKFHGRTHMNIREISNTIDVVRNVFLSFRSYFKAFARRSDSIILIIAIFFYVACKF